MMVTVSLDSPPCEVNLFDPISVVYRDTTRQTKRLYRLKYVGALWSGLAYLSRYNSGWFCHSDGGATWGKQGRPARGREGGGKAGVGTWLGAVRRGGGGGAAHGRQERRRRIGQQNRGEGGKVDEGGLNCNFPETQGLHCNI
jgi:hypothetical protein